MASYSIGIIPAAGKAQRFGGVLKELLPACDGLSFLRHAVVRLPVDEVIIVTNADKIEDHAREIGSSATYAIQSGNNDIWSAIDTAIHIPASRYLLTFPDTLIPDDVFAGDPGDDFVMGVFQTMIPGRFGVLSDRGVINKDASLPIPATAWGVLGWSGRVVDYWLQTTPASYTDAINLAIKAFGYGTFPLAYYCDMATVQDYQDYLRAYV